MESWRQGWEERGMTSQQATSTGLPQPPPLSLRADLRQAIMCRAREG